MPINPERLRRLRKGRNLSRAKLSERARGVSVRTIQRLESDSEASKTPREHTLERLAGALRVEEGVLTGELPFPELDEPATPEPVQIGAKIDPMARLAYDFIKRRYGVSATEIIDMAPLFFVLLAEGSLAQRRERVQEAYETIAHLERIRQSTDGAYHCLNMADTQGIIESIGDSIDSEEASIRKIDLFGEGLLSDSKNPWIADPFDPYDTNPFADYLRGLANALDKRSVVFCLQTGLLGSFPPYWICLGMLKDITNGSDEARSALTSGAVRLDEIPEELMAEGAGEARAEWLADRAPTLDILDIDALLSEIEDQPSETGDRDDAESGERRDDR